MVFFFSSFSFSPHPGMVRFYSALSLVSPNLVFATQEKNCLFAPDRRRSSYQSYAFLPTTLRVPGCEWSDVTAAGHLVSSLRLPSMEKRREIYLGSLADLWCGGVLTVAFRLSIPHFSFTLVGCRRRRLTTQIVPYQTCLPSLPPFP